MMDRLVRNKENAMAFYDLMFNQSKPREAMERYAGARYIQIRLDDDGKVVEHWEVLQVVPPTAAHSNGIF